MELAGVSKPAEDIKIDFAAKTKELQQEAEFHETADRLANPPSFRELQEKHLKDAEDKEKAAAKRVQDLEDERLTRIQQESDASAQEAQRQKELREKAEDDLRKSQTQLILDEIKRLHEINVSPEKKIEEYLLFNDMMEKRFGKADKPPTEQPAALDSKVAFELKKMEIGLEQWKIEMGLKRDELQYKRELDKEERLDNKELKKEELQLKAKNQQFLADLPKVLADTFAAGIVARVDAGGASVPISANPGASQAVSHFEAVVGEAGELDCPKCATKVGVGPTTTQTVCSKCGQKFEIKRVPPETAPKPNEPAENRE
jgi:hypothetical protein